MTVTPPFGQPASPLAASSAPEPEQATGRSRRTVIIAAAAGAIALGVLGGVAVLTLGGEEMATGPLAPPAVVAVPVVEPSSPPSPSLPLPTAVVQGRNVFVPLVPPLGTDGAVAAGGGAAAGTVSEGTVAAAPAPGSPSTSGAGTRTVTTPSGTTSGGSSGTTSGASSAVAAAEKRARDLQAQIMALTQRLADVGDDDAELREQLTGLQSEHEALLAEHAALRRQSEADAAERARLRTVAFVSVAADTSPGQRLELTIDGIEHALDLDPATDDVPASVTLGTSAAGEPVELTYLSADAVEDPPGVRVQVGSASYHVTVGGVLTFSIA